MAEELKYQSEHTGQQIDQAIDNYVAMTQAVQTAGNSAAAASASAAAAAQSAADAQAVTQGQKGYFETDTALKAAHPTGQVGWWAIVGSTDTIWVWDNTTSTWLNSGNQTDLSNYYTKAQADAEFPAGTIVLESADPTLVPLNADTLGGQASSYYGRAADIGAVSNLTTTAKTVVPAINELNQNLTTTSTVVSAINYAAGSIKLGKSGHIVECQVVGVVVNQPLPAGTWYPIGTIPAGFRAAYDVYKTLLASSKQYTLWIATSGVISLMPVSAAGASGDGFYDCFSWIV